MAKIVNYALICLFPSSALAFDVSGAAPEAAEYARCVYEMKHVNVSRMASPSSEATEFLESLIILAFKTCNKERSELVKYAYSKGLSKEEVYSRMKDTDNNLNAALRMTIAKELITED